MQAAIEARRLRLRPILMTSIAFIMGVLPLAFSVGAGAEMRQAMGVAVFSGMIGAAGPESSGALAGTEDARSVAA